MSAILCRPQYVYWINVTIELNIANSGPSCNNMMTIQASYANGVEPRWQFNTLWPSDTIWWPKPESSLAQVMACCRMATSHYLNQCWLFISEILWNSPEGNFAGNTQDIYLWYQFENHEFKITVTSPRDQWVKYKDAVVTSTRDQWFQYKDAVLPVKGNSIVETRPSGDHIISIKCEIAHNLITVMSNVGHGVSNHWGLDSLFKSNIKENIKACVTDPLWGESIDDWWIPLTKGQ